MIDPSLMPELPEPYGDAHSDHWNQWQPNGWSGGTPIFTEDQIKAYGAQCYLLAMERAAQAVLDEMVDAEATGDPEDHAYNLALVHAYAAIRALALQEMKNA